MKELAQTIENEVDATAVRLHGLPESFVGSRPASGKWSPKEVLGHLVDSAHNNIRRLVCGQYQNRPHIVYHQDEWVAVQHYQLYQWPDLIVLWLSLNRHFAHILAHLPEADAERLCDTGKSGSDLHSLRWLAEDYLEHLRHHVKQIL
ncbi:MAG: DinB family protein [Saprospiraceae bacterium]